MCDPLDAVDTARAVGSVLIAFIKFQLVVCSCICIRRLLNYIK